MTHSTDQEHFIPPGLRIIHISASESRLFPRVAAILQAVQEPPITQGTVHFHKWQRWRIFYLDAPARELLEKDGEDNTTEAESTVTHQSEMEVEEALGCCTGPSGATSGDQPRSAASGRNHTGAWSKPHQQMCCCLLPEVRHLGTISSFLFIYLNPGGQTQSLLISLTRQTGRQRDGPFPSF